MKKLLILMALLFLLVGCVSVEVPVEKTDGCCPQVCQLQEPKIIVVEKEVVVEKVVVETKETFVHIPYTVITPLPQTTIIKNHIHNNGNIKIVANHNNNKETNVNVNKNKNK